MSWIALRITPASNREGVIAALFEAGSQGVQEDDACVVTHFPGDAPIDAIRQAVIDADPRADVCVADAPETDYSQWRASVSSHRVGELVISPPWLAKELDPRRTIIVDPAMAFGTGEHASTRGVMRLMQGAVRAGDAVADLGAGSAVLSIAAVKLGPRASPRSRSTTTRSETRKRMCQPTESRSESRSSKETRRRYSRCSRRFEWYWRTSSRRF